MGGRILAITLLILLAGMCCSCGSSSSNARPSSSMNGSTSMLAGSWSITTTGDGQSSTIQATFVPNGTAPSWPSGISTCLSIGGCVDQTACNLGWIYGVDPDISVRGPECFTAATVARLGSISDSNGATDLFLLVGAGQAPVPNGSSLYFAFLENYQGSVWLFTGIGAASGGNITGSWTCSDEYVNVLTTLCPNNQHVTFSGTQE
jgi:hypothetical protein